MKLYQVTFDGDEDYVEAASYGQAVARWRAELKRQNPDEDEEWSDTEEPESVVLISSRPVLRSEHPEAVGPEER